MSEEEECDTCDQMAEEIPDINNAVSYLLEEKKVLADWDGVEKDLQQNKDKSAVECLLEHIYVMISDKCLLEASYEVFSIFREKKEDDYNKTQESIQQLWFDIVETLSRTYSECSADFREEVNKNVSGGQSSTGQAKRREEQDDESGNDMLELNEEEEDYAEGFY